MNTPNKVPLAKKWPRRLLIAAAVLLVLLALLVALIALTAPRIIKTERIREAIERTVSKELGGTVTIDQVDLAVLPRPEITLRKLSIDVPDTVSATAAAVDIYARLLPLLWGRFEVSSVALDRPVLSLSLPSSAGPDAGGRKKREAGRSVGSVLAVAGRTMPDLSLNISRGSLTLTREGEKLLSFRDLSAQLAFVADEKPPADAAGQGRADQFHIAGSAKTLLSLSAVLPDEAGITIGRFDAGPGDLVFSQARARMLDIDLKGSGVVRNYLSGSAVTELAVNGSLGRNGVNWISALAGLPGTTTVQAPIRVRDLRLRFSGSGVRAQMSLAGKAQLPDETDVSLSLRKRADSLALEHLAVKDRDSDAVLQFNRDRDTITLSFKGSLAGETVSRIVSREHVMKRIAGDLRVTLPLGRWTGASAEGLLEGENIMIASGLTGSFTLDRFAVKASAGTLELHPLVLSLGPDILTAEGTASLSQKGVALDLDVAADRIQVAALKELLSLGGGEKRGAAQQPERPVAVSGELRARAREVSFPSFTAQTVVMNVSLADGRTSAELKQATVCGIDLRGTLQTIDRGADIRLEPAVRGGALNDSLSCLLRENASITGTYDLSGFFTSRGPWDTLLPSLHGTLDLTAKQGRISSDRIVKAIIAYLNSTSLLKGSHAALLREGEPYETIVLRGSVREGVILVQQALIRGKDIHLAADGTVNLRNKTLALTVLAAPFTSMDRLLGSIPIVKQLAGDALIVVPVRVEGPFGAPTVRALAASGVSTNIKNLMKNVVKAPMKIVDPDRPAGQREETTGSKGDTLPSQEGLGSKEPREPR